METCLERFTSTMCLHSTETNLRNSTFIASLPMHRPDASTLYGTTRFMAWPWEPAWYFYVHPHHQAKLHLTETRVGHSLRRYSSPRCLGSLRNCAAYQFTGTRPTYGNVLSISLRKAAWDFSSHPIHGDQWRITLGLCLKQATNIASQNPTSTNSTVVRSGAWESGVREFESRFPGVAFYC